MIKLLLYLAFFLGIFTHLLMSAQASVRSKSNGLNDAGLAWAGMSLWFKLNIVSIIIRLVLEFAGFGFLLANPQVLTGYKVLGISLSLAWYFVVPIGIGTDAFFDSGIFIFVKLLQDRFPALKGVSIDIPSLVPPPADPPKADQQVPPTGPPGTH